MTSADKLLTEPEVASWLSVSPRTVQGWRLRLKGPKHVVVAGKLIRYRESDVKDWLLSQQVKQHA